MAHIDCPGSDTFNSTRTRTSSGVFTESNRQSAVTRAHDAVMRDLASQVDQAECDGDCLKVPGPTNIPTPRGTCRRIWWTLWIAVQCSATASGTARVDCRVQS